MTDQEFEKQMKEINDKFEEDMKELRESLN